MVTYEMIPLGRVVQLNEEGMRNGQSGDSPMRLVHPILEDPNQSLMELVACMQQPDARGDYSPRFDGQLVFLHAPQYHQHSNIGGADAETWERLVSLDQLMYRFAYQTKG